MITSNKFHYIEEKNTLMTYLAFLRNATKDTVETLDSLAKDNRDPLLLVMGSIAEFASDDVSF